jgi:predicted nucleic acid-binding Zn ribbon protein
MQCPSCGRENRAEVRFCESCGEPLAVAAEQTCPACGTRNRPGVRFCESCGEPLAVAKGQTCPACGTRNRPGVRFCESCGEALVGRPRPVRRRSLVLSQAPGLLLTIVGLVLVAILSTVATRFVLSFVMPPVSTPTGPTVTPDQAIERANLYVAEQYPDFLAVEPTVRLALDGEREVFAVGYTRGSAITLDDPLTTLVVSVDAETGETELLASGISR